MPFQVIIILVKSAATKEAHLQCLGLEDKSGSGGSGDIVFPVYSV